MDKRIRNMIKNIKKIISIINKNNSIIKEILVSEMFLNQILELTKYINIDVEIKEIDELEHFYLFNKPMNMSNFIYEGCILILKNEEYIVLKGI